MTLGEKIKYHRELLDMTQEELGNKIGVKGQTVARYESGKIAEVGGKKIGALAKALNVTAAYLMEWTDDPDSNGSKHSSDVAVLLEKAHKDEGIRILLDASADLTKEDLKIVIDLARQLRKRSM